MRFHPPTIILIGLMLLPGALAAETATFDDVLALPAPAPDQTYQWGGHPAQRIEVYRPDPSAEPTRHAVLIHGGCWLNQYAMGYMRPMAAAMAERGWMVWSFGYRRLGDVDDAGTRGMADLLAGMDQVRRLADDEAPPWLIGHSAGGHLALLVAGELGPERVAGVAALGGITDPQAYADQDTGCNEAAARLLAESRAPERLDPARHLPLGRPLVLFHGERDAIVPMGQAVNFARQATEAGDTARVIAPSEAGHFEPVMPDSEAFSTLMEALESTISRSR